MALGYCRGSPEEWDWDGSFGSPTNPKPGGPQSDWVKQNAKSGGARNEDYYKKIEDDNRAAHVKFRKENPIFYEQIPELLPRLESIEKNVYNNCTYCEYDPKSDGKYQELVTRLSGNRRQNGGNGKGNGGKSQPRNNRRVSNNSNNRRNNSNNRRNNANNQRKNRIVKETIRMVNETIRIIEETIRTIEETIPIIERTLELIIEDQVNKVLVVRKRCRNANLFVDHFLVQLKKHVKVIVQKGALRK